MIGALELENPRNGFLRRRKRNRRVQVEKRSLLTLLSEGIRWFLRGFVRVVRVVGMFILVVGILGLCVWGTHWGIRHVVASPRFAIQEIQLPTTPHISVDELLERIAVKKGESLLTVDTDAVASRLVAHPWVRSAEARRSLPSTLVVNLVEQKGMAAVLLDSLYIIDERGRPFKRATMAEVEGLPVFTGISRSQYAAMRDTSEAAFREGLKLLAEYQSKPDRPAISEVSIDPRFGYSLFLFSGGGEIRLGQGAVEKKLAQLDRILEAVLQHETKDASALRLVHLDLLNSGRVPVLLRESQASISEKPLPPFIVKHNRIVHGQTQL